VLSQEQTVVAALPEPKRTKKTKKNKKGMARELAGVS